ncbi:hypothetical protein [Entomobacter blattae]|uniref:Alpha/beta hydrolase n=1 Tax=Entomobacter blattae TaxID=2762277 RepID=A0A7H1NQB0_9PROT|nr:hypothetical protein [Entomobacter blattae]QNT77970.1 hypothetical protein JGUZn3_07350 [Entomobacter blattae]
MIIYNSEDIVVHYESGDTNYVIVTFMGIGEENNSETEYFLKGYCLKHKISCIGFTSKKRSWYTSSYMKNALKKALSIITQNYQHSIGIGFSAGGFAAIYYAKSLNLDCVFSFAPSFKIDIEYYKSKYNLSSNHINHFNSIWRGNFNKNESIEKKTIVLFDPYNLTDKLMKEELIRFFEEKPRNNNLLFIPIFYALHLIPLSFRRSDIYHEMIYFSLGRITFDKLKEKISYVRRHNITNIYHRLRLGHRQHPLLTYRVLKSNFWKNPKIQKSKKI